MGGNSPIGRKIPGKLNVEKELSAASVMMRNLVKLVHSVAEKLLVMGNFTYSIPLRHLHRMLGQAYQGTTDGIIF